MKNNHNKKILANQTGYTENIPSENLKRQTTKEKLQK